MAQYHIENDKLSARVGTRGAALLALRWRADDRPLIVEFSDPGDPVLQEIYAGVIVGPVANRLATPVTCADDTYDLPVNEPPNVCLHGGVEGLSARDWIVVSQDADHITLAITLPDGACGLPGTRDIRVTYALEGANLTLTLTATTDHPTLFAPAHHPYWTLGHDGPCSDLTLGSPAPEYLPTAHNQLPTGQTVPVAETAFDYRTPAPVHKDSDHCLCLSDTPHPTPLPAATLTAPSGMSLTISSIEPGLQLYGGAGLPTLPPNRTYGPALRPHSAVALEPQFWPNAPAHPDFPQPLLTPDRPYRQITRYSLTA